MKMSNKHKLISEHESHFLVHDGKGAIPIARKGLSSFVEKHIRSLPKYAEGGEIEVEKLEKPIPKNPVDYEAVEKVDYEPIKNKKEKKMAEGGEAEAAPQDNSDETSAQPIAEAAPAAPLAERAGNYLRNLGIGAYEDTKAALSKVANPILEGSSNFAKGLTEEKPQAPSEPESVEGGAQAPAAEQATAEAEAPKNPLNSGPANPLIGQNPEVQYTKDVLGSLDKQQQAIQASAQAESIAQKQIADAFEKQQKNLDAAKTAHDSEMQVLNDRDAQLFKDVQDSKIDPNRYYSNMSTGQKVGSAIALILGGLSGGLNKSGRNPAMEVLNNQIDRDINAQRDNLTTKNNLYKMNLERTGNEYKAYAQTKLDMLTMTQAQINQYAATAKSDQAKANAAQAISQLDQQKAGLKYQIAASNAVNISGPSPQSLRAAIMSGRIPQQQVPGAIKELGQYQKMQAEMKEADEAFDTMAKNANLTQRFMGEHGPSLRESTRNYEGAKLFLDKFTKDTSGRVVPLSAHLIGQSLPMYGDTPATIQANRNRIKQVVAARYQFPTLETANLLGNLPQSGGAGSPIGASFKPIGTK